MCFPHYQNFKNNKETKLSSTAQRFLVIAKLTSEKQLRKVAAAQHYSNSVHNLNAM
jgi:hypothetical protein